MERPSENDRGSIINKLLRVLDFGNGDEIEKVVKAIQTQYMRATFRLYFKQYETDNPETEDAAIADDTDKTRRKKADVIFIFDKINWDKMGVKHMAELSLKELEEMKPEEVYLSDLGTDEYFLANIRWLLENEPENTGELFQKDRNALKAKALKAAQRATLLYCQLEKGGLDRFDANERAMEIVAPVDGPAFQSEPPERLPEALELEILGWSEALDEP